jgi:ParB/RepB/Spo0J family partition protein
MKDTHSDGTVGAVAALTVALDAITVEERFNPRAELERRALERLADSIRLHGVVVPLVVAPADERGRHRLLAGHRRLAAARAVGLTELPVVVREAPDPARALELALVENIAREQLDPLEEARAFRRLLDAGLTRKGIAERLSVAQKRVTERLEILELPDELHTQVRDGTIPPGAVKALVRLARIHPDLPAVAVAKVGYRRHAWDEPLTWTDIASDPIAAVGSRYEDEPGALPEGVFETGSAYPVGRFTLDAKAERRLADVCALSGLQAAELRVPFGAEEAEQPEALGAAHRSREGHACLIVGQQVADQLARDWLERVVREHRRATREGERNESDSGAPADATAGAGEGAASLSEEKLAERRRAERAAEQEARRKATAHNAELGAAVVKAFARVKLDARAVKLLACLNLGGELEPLAMRGARYGFPGWTETVEQRNGRTKTVYIERREDAGRKAREYLAVAKSAPELAGRLLALVAMARYADEACVAQSACSYYAPAAPRGLPWSDEVVDLVDELAAERLPDHLTETIRQERREQREREAERERLRTSVEQRLERAGELSAPEREQLGQDAQQAYGRWSAESHRVMQRLHELDADADGRQTAEAPEAA